MTPQTALHWAATNPGWALGFNALAMTGTALTIRRLLAYRAGTKIRRAQRLAHAEANPEAAEKRRAEVDRRRANAMTIIAATIASGMSLTGMWPVVTDAIQQAGIEGELQKAISIVLLGFIEVAVLASGLRARANVRVHGTTGKDGIAMWVIVTFSAILGALEATDATGVIVRLITPFGAAWLWERGLAPEREAHGTRQKLHWRVTTRRIAIFLRLAEPEEADLAQKSRYRRLGKIAKNVVLAKTGGRFISRWAAWRVKRHLFAAAKYNAFDPSDDISLVDHIAIRAAADALIKQDVAPADRFLGDMRQSPTVSDMGDTTPATPATDVAGDTGDDSDTGDTDSDTVSESDVLSHDTTSHDTCDMNGDTVSEDDIPSNVVPLPHDRIVARVHAVDVAAGRPNATPSGGDTVASQSDTCSDLGMSCDIEPATQDGVAEGDTTAIPLKPVSPPSVVAKLSHPSLDEILAAGGDRAKATRSYLDSLATATPLTGADLSRMFGKGNAKWGQRVIQAVRRLNLDDIALSDDDDEGDTEPEGDTATVGL